MAEPPDAEQLARAAATGDPVAIQALEAQTFPGARAALARMGFGRADIDDVMQAVRAHLFLADGTGTARIADVVGRGDLRGLVRIIAVRTGLNLRRRHRREHALDEPIDDAPVIEMLGAVDDSPELAVLKDQQRQVFKAALEEALTTLAPRERTVLRMYVVHDLSIDDIGRAYQVHRATAARWLETIRQRVHDHARTILQARLGAAPHELEAIYRLVASRLEVSFSRILADLPAPREKSR